MFQQRINWLMKRPWLVGVIFVVIVVLSFAAGAAFVRDQQSTFTLEDGSVVGIGEVQRMAEDVDFQMFWDVWKILQDDYLRGPVSEKDLLYSALDGLVQGVGDPYSRFFNPEDAQGFETDLEGKFEGIGAEIAIKDDRVVIVAPLAGSPAITAGIKAGDTVYLIDEADTTGMSIDEAVRRIRGPGGSIVTLTVSHDGMDDIVEVPITRDVIEISSVEWEVRDDGVAVIDIFFFNEDTARNFNKAVVDVLAQGASSLVIDMRNNPGGFLDRAVTIAGEWVGNKTVVFEKMEDGYLVPLDAQGVARLAGLKTVVLVNGGSASATEIVAGALQDYELATVIGEQTFGKGSVQSYREFNDGSGLKLTIAEWLTPKGRSIQDDGITPDEIIEYTEEDFDAGIDQQFDRAIEILKTNE
ncbi:S41 family peptidase [Candidatus Uhrbacteria bacterium]|nr:S41 family peptidase [Candidatus Uhrbacteria bacterium]